MDRQQDEKEDSGIEQDNQWVFVRVSLEDLQLQKVVKLNIDETVWTGKVKFLKVLPRELNDALNFGFFLPPSNGRSGKFLDESRLLRDYPLRGGITDLQFKYKRRLFKSPGSVEKSDSVKINVKKFVEAIRTNQTSKVARFLDKGFDPNMHISDEEFPLSIAAVELVEPRSMIMTLVNGGAHLDFRTRRSALTALHLSSIHQRKQSILILLELGASANVFDRNNLTPLYHLIQSRNSCNDGNSSLCALILLRDHSIVDCSDKNGSTELHQAVRLGLGQHVEHLLFYRADINRQDDDGNTPLHISILNNQELCLRILLFRGAETNIVNKTNKTPLDLALALQRRPIVELIESHRSDSIVPFKESPLINPKRRSIYVEHSNDEFSCRRSSSKSNRPKDSALNIRSLSMPRLNPLHNDQERSSSRSSSPKSFSVQSDHGFNSESTSHMSTASRSNKTGQSSSSDLSERKRLYSSTPGRKCLCIKSYRSTCPGELDLNKGDIIEILSVGEQGFIEGRINGNEGWFAADHVQDISLYNGDRQMDDKILISRDALSALMINNDIYSPRTIVIQRGKKGFGFVLRGSRVAGNLFQPSPSFPALQFLDSIEKGSNADKAGLKQNDYLLEINGINVVSMPHEDCVHLIKRSGDTLALKVVTAHFSCQTSSSTMTTSISQSSQSLPFRRRVHTRSDVEPSTINVVSSLSSSTSSTRSSPFRYLFDFSQSPPLIIKRKENFNVLDDLGRSMILPNASPVESTFDPHCFPSISAGSKLKPIVPERESSLSDLVEAPSDNRVRGRVELVSTSSTSNVDNESNQRRNSNSSSNEADEEASFSSSSNSNRTSMTDENLIGQPSQLSTFKQRQTKEVEIISRPALVQSTNNDDQTKRMPSDFKVEIEQAKDRLKKVPLDSSSSSSSSSTTNHPEQSSEHNEKDFPPPPSPTTLRRSLNLRPKETVDPRCDANFSTVIAQRAAESKARRHETKFEFDSTCKGLPPSTTFFNNCVTKNRSDLRSNFNPFQQTHRNN